MSFPHFDFFKSTPPTPRAVLLSDACFFVRSVSVEAGVTAEQVTAQAELAIEGLSPFPLQQLYHGMFWEPGSTKALIFAAYRRRFAQEQVEAWVDAEWVAPHFCLVLSMPVKGPATVIYTSDDSMTAVHWSEGRVPESVTVVPLSEEPKPEELTAVRDRLLRAVGDVGQVIDFPTAPALAGSSDEDNYLVQAGSDSCKMPIALAAAMDVRPREDLAVLRHAKRREMMLWRICLGSVIALLVLGLGELILGPGWLYQRTRKAQVAAQAPVVEKIMTAQALAFRIEELSSQRLLPFEMITALSEKKPKTIQFLRTSTTGLRTMRVEAQTGNAGDVAVWQSMLTAHPAIDSIEVKDMSSRDNLTKFTLVANFKPNALKAETTP